MFSIIRTFEISACHALRLAHSNCCTNMHGHNFRITIFCQSPQLDANDMVIDFLEIEQNIKNKLDHTSLNIAIQCNPTAERLAEWICNEVGECCKKVEVEECQGCIAIYERD